jgi:chromosome segregation protein
VVELVALLDTRLQGSASFFALDCLPAPAVGNPAAGSDVTQQPGFVAEAAGLARPAPGQENLVAHLLGNTIVVEDLRTALAISRAAPAGSRFVTVSGDILDPDGTITTGDPNGNAGLVSRKSQLRALQDELKSLDGRIAGSEQELEENGRGQSRLKSQRAILESQLTAAADRAAQLGNQLSQRRQQIASLQEELNLQHSEIAAIDRDLAELTGQRAVIQDRMVATGDDRQRIEELIQDLDAEVDRGSVDVEERQNELTASKIELAKTEGQLGGLRQRLASLTADMEDRRRVQRETQDQIGSAADRECACQRKILAASSQVAELFLRKERLSREIATLAGRCDDFRGQRQTLSAESQAGRETLQRVQSELHQRQLEASDIRHQRATLVERIREDYELDLASLYTDYQPDTTLDREATQQEIQELRRKIAGLGNVNLEALAELQELETRSTTLHAQIADLSQSKATLDEIIRKINQDSQRLFMETLEAIRSHFGELFRKLFGGGRADIVLENEGDVLESGIEIVARPPGKELRSLSLLSGGEKTLTTVALLMAVFRSKPSPFCILDEVDAALDEANIERYTTLLREFASQAQFIMITHSKKSMICADVLYGVTMQESGVSKRVSVRFEDVGEQGEISHAAIERAESPEPPAVETPSGQEAA